MPLSGIGRPLEQCPPWGAETYPWQAAGEAFRPRPWIGQEHQAQVGQVLPLQSPMVRLPFAFELHAPDSHAKPAVQSAKLIDDLGERGREVIRGPSYDRVDFLDDLGVQVVMPGRQFANLVFEFLHGLGPHARGP